MYPLSFAEFMSVYPGTKQDGWNEYITTVKRVVHTTVERDITYLLQIAALNGVLNAQNGLIIAMIKID